MKKIGKVLAECLALLAISGTALAVSACSFVNPDDGSNSSSSSSIAPSLTLNKERMTLDINEEAYLFADAQGIAGDIVWESSNTAIATVSADGLVKAIREGTADITVSCGDYSSKCTITVSADGKLPVVELNGDSAAANVYLGDTFAITAKTYYDGVEITGVTYEYTVSDSMAAEIGTDGTLITKKAGNVTVQVKATWLDFEVYKTISITIEENTYIQTEQREITLYTSGVFGDKTTETLDIKVFENGAEVQNPSFTYEYDATALKIEDGVISVIKNEQANYTVTATYGSGDSAKAVEFFVKVIYPIRDMTATYNSYVFEALADNAPTVFDCFADGSNVVAVYDSEEPTVNMVQDGKLKLTAKFYGDREWVVHSSEGYAYEVKGSVVTKKIRTAEDFVSVFLSNVNPEKPWSVDENLLSEMIYDGYYVLENDIAFDDTWYVSKYRPWGISSGLVNADAGFQGVFDGQGHTISGLGITNYDNYNWVGGVFGTISGKGVVKNVAFANAKLAGTSTANVAAFLANGIVGTMENVFIHLDMNKSTIDSNGRINVFAYGLSASTVLKNCVGYVTGSASTNGCAKISVGEYKGGLQKENAINSYIVYDNALTLANSFDLTSYKQSEIDGGTASFGTFGSEWSMKNGVPVLKSAEILVFGNKAVYTIEVWKENGSSYENITDSLNLPTYKGEVGTVVSVIDLDKSFIPTGYEIDYAHEDAVISGEITADGSLTLKIYLNVIREKVEITENYFALKQTNASGTVVAQDLNIDFTSYTEVSSVRSVFVNGVLISSDCYSFDAGKLTIGNAAFSTLNCGEQFIVEVSTNEKNYKITYGVLATFAVTKASDINAGSGVIAPWQSANGMNWTDNPHTETARWGGYTVLANDIDFGGANIKAKVACANAYGGSGYGFYGTFDGLGHTLTNFKIEGTNVSLFGRSDFGAVIKNVRFTNFTTGGVAAFGLFDSNCYAQIDNIYVDGTCGSVLNNGSLLGGLRTNDNNGAKLTNSTIIVRMGDDLTSESSMVTGKGVGSVLSAAGTTIYTDGVVESSLTENGATVKGLSEVPDESANA